MEVQVDSKAIEAKLTASVSKQLVGLSEAVIKVQTDFDAMLSRIDFAESSMAAAGASSSALTEQGEALTSKLAALQCLQRLLARPDGHDIFQKFDTDGDGTVSRVELQLGLRQIGEILSEQELDAVMVIADKDGDGEVDYTELVKMTADKDRMEEQAQIVEASSMATEALQVKMHCIFSFRFDPTTS